MKRFPDPEQISPEEFELMVKGWFDSFSDDFDSFASEHRESLNGFDGDYEIDVTVRFQAFAGSEFLVICECKRHSNPIKRETVQILKDRRDSIGAQKAFLVSTAPFQSGAEDYARIHRIALIQVSHGSLAYITNNATGHLPKIPSDADPYIGMFDFEMASGSTVHVAVSSDTSYFLEEFLRSA